MDKLNYSIAETTGLLGVGRTTVYSEIAAGRLESIKIGRRRVIPAIALQKYMDDELAKAAQARREQPA